MIEKNAASDRVEVRRNEDGTIDEVVLYRDGRCIFHIEQDTRRSWYFTLDDGTDETYLFFIDAKKRVSVRLDTDEISPLRTRQEDSKMNDQDNDTPDQDLSPERIDLIAIALADVSFCGEHIGEAPVPCDHFREDAVTLVAALRQRGLCVVDRLLLGD
jgi:hypothetical protein